MPLDFENVLGSKFVKCLSKNVSKIYEESWCNTQLSSAVDSLINKQQKKTVPLSENSCKHNYFTDDKHSMENCKALIYLDFHGWENRTCPQ